MVVCDRVVLVVLRLGSVSEAVKGLTNVLQRGPLVDILQELSAHSRSIMIVVKLIIHEVKLHGHVVVVDHHVLEVVWQHALIKPGHLVFEVGLALLPFYLEDFRLARK